MVSVLDTVAGLFVLALVYLGGRGDVKTGGMLGVRDLRGPSGLLGSAHAYYL